MIRITFIHGDKEFTHDDKINRSLSHLQNELQLQLTWIIEHRSIRYKLRKKYIKFEDNIKEGIRLDVFRENMTDEVTVRFNIAVNDEVLNKIFWKVVKQYLQKQSCLAFGWIKEK